MNMNNLDLYKTEYTLKSGKLLILVRLLQGDDLFAEIEHKGKIIYKLQVDENSVKKTADEIIISWFLHRYIGSAGEKAINGLVDKDGELRYEIVEKSMFFKFEYNYIRFEVQCIMYQKKGMNVFEIYYSNSANNDVLSTYVEASTYRELIEKLQMYMFTISGIMEQFAVRDFGLLTNAFENIFEE